MSEFDFERLDVYKAVVELIILVDEIVEHLPRGRAYLADQLQRAGTSVPINIGPSSNSEQPGCSNCQVPMMPIVVSAIMMQNSPGSGRDRVRRAWPHVLLRSVQRV